ncbi:MAG: hypothetical protein V3U09_03635 [Thermoplasmata archaeon]
MIDDMLNRCMKCGEQCIKQGSQWNVCAEFSDEEWAALFAAGALLFGEDGLDML